MVQFFHSAIAAQIVGFIAVTICILSYQTNRLRLLLSVRVVSELVFALHYLMLGAFTGAAIQVVGGIRNGAFLWHAEKARPKTVRIVLFCVIFTLTGALTWEGPLSLIPIVAKNASTVAYGMTDTRAVRFIELPAYALWLVYNWLCGSIAGVLNALFCLVSLLIACVRFRSFRGPEAADGCGKEAEK